MRKLNISSSFSKWEEEIIEHLGGLFKTDVWLVEGEDIYNYFRQHKQHLHTFANYVDKGKQMDKNSILYKLSELYLEHTFFNEKNMTRTIYRDADIAWTWITSVFEQLSSNLSEYKEKTENYVEILHRINPKFPTNIERYNVDLVDFLEETCNSFLEMIRHCFQNLIPQYEKEDEEMCTALCIGLWWCFDDTHNFDFQMKMEE